jgi:hypothetical protein
VPSVPFQEDEWLGGVLSFGEGDDAPAITVTMRDERCSMVNLDPDSASSAPEVLKAVVRANQNTAGIYGAVTRIGRLAVGQTILLRAATEKGNVGDRNTMSRNAAQPSVKPDGPCHGSTAAALDLVESAIGRFPIDARSRQAGSYRLVRRI